MTDSTNKKNTRPDLALKVDSLRIFEDSCTDDVQAWAAKPPRKHRTPTLTASDGTGRINLIPEADEFVEFTDLPGGANCRDYAYAILSEHVKNPALVKHMLAVEAAMRAYARKLGEDEDKWGIVGLLHDFDYERWPDPPDHPLKGSEILRERGYPEDMIYAILSHADYLQDFPRVHLMDKALYACDELCGLISAAALVRPTGITDLKASSVKKKMKSKGFAKGVNREDIERGAADFGAELTEHIQFIIDAMNEIGEELGLTKGSV